MSVQTEQGMLCIMDSTGDTRIMWDPRNADEVDIAKAAFKKAKDKGMVAYAVDQTTGEKVDGEVIREFDPARGKIIMAPQLVGG
jgi:hypothetical protein